MEITSVTNSVGIDRAVVANTDSQKAAAKTAQDPKTVGKAAPQKAAGTRPVGGGGAKPAAPASTGSASKAASASSSSVKTYDKRDLNQDGTVSPQEAAKFDLLHPAMTTDKQTPVSTSQVKQGLNAYQQAQSSNVTAKALNTIA